MKVALQEAKSAMLKDSVPVGAVIVFKDDIIARSSNNSSHAIAHAEILAIRASLLKLNAKVLPECDLYTTLEPCAMCSGAISLARIKRLYFGAYDQKDASIQNGIFHHCNHSPEVYGGIMEEDCSQLLKDFFQKKRQSSK